MRNTLGALDRRRSAEQAVVLYSKQQGADYTVLRVGDLQAPSSPSASSSPGSAANGGGITVAGGDVLDGATTPSVVAAALTQIVTRQDPVARNVSLGLQGTSTGEAPLKRRRRIRAYRYSKRVFHLGILSNFCATSAPLLQHELAPRWCAPQSRAVPLLFTRVFALWYHHLYLQVVRASQTLLGMSSFCPSRGRKFGAVCCLLRLHPAKRSCGSASGRTCGWSKAAASPRRWDERIWRGAHQLSRMCSFLVLTPTFYDGLTCTFPPSAAALPFAVLS